MATAAALEFKKARKVTFNQLAESEVEKTMNPILELTKAISKQSEWKSCSSYRKSSCYDREARIRKRAPRDAKFCMERPEKRTEKSKNDLDTNKIDQEEIKNKLGVRELLKIAEESLAKRKANSNITSEADHDRVIRDIEAKRTLLKKQREAARLALEQMKPTVEWNYALEVTKEFEKLINAK